MNYILETERLQLRELTPGDVSFVIALMNSPGWLKFIGDRNIKTVEQATTYLENGPLKSYSDNGFGLWLVELKGRKISIGMCGILKRETLETPDLGFAFLPEFIGKGFGFEAATATVAFAKEKIKLNSLCAIMVPYNHASIKVLEKAGMKFSKRITLPHNAEELLLYQINLQV